jgi:serine/threonine protein kinase/Tol biopolymer transport system component
MSSRENPERHRLVSGTQLGTYRIETFLGEGGVGTIYRALDCKLQRPVAIKVLSDELADAAARRRFQREAQMASSLNHPHILTVHDIGEFEDRQYIVTEFVDGGTLKDWAKAERRNWRQIVELLTGVADALASAHEARILHRDIKPANILVTKNGYAKLADFGLAKLAENVDIDLTRTGGATLTGVIVGTIAYMSPEQASGQQVDARSDIFSFGVVLYELLAGRRPFIGVNDREVLKAIQSAPDPLPETIPPALRQVVEKALERDPADRYQSMREIVVDLRRMTRRRDELRPTSVPSAPARWRPLLWVGIFALGVAAIALILAVLFFRQPPAAALEMRFEVTTPPTTDPVSLAISPDGQQLVFVASSQGNAQLWVRPLDSLTARPLAGTDGAAYPFWSPDGQSIGFFADGKLRRIDIAGGPPLALADAPSPRGGAWSPDGTILFAPVIGALHRVSSAGGETFVVTHLQAGIGSHRFPQFLPGSRHFLYFAPGSPEVAGVYVGSIDGSTSKRLLEADAAAIYSPAGFLLFVRQGALLAQKFDTESLQLAGSPFPLVDRIVFERPIYSAAISAAGNGTIAYRTGEGPGLRRLAWFDRTGKEIGVVVPPDPTGLQNPELSPDGKRIALYRSLSANTDVWLIETDRMTRFTFNAAQDNFPVWSHDGRQILFGSDRRGPYDVYMKSSSGAGEEQPILESPQTKSPLDWSSDGQFVLIRDSGRTDYDLSVLPLFGDRKRIPVANSAYDEREGQFSPDVRWIAYQSNESGRYEVYIQPFPGPGPKSQISTNGGTQARWRSDGKELFYIALDSKMMAVPLTFSPNRESVAPGTPIALFPTRIDRGPVPPGKHNYDVRPDGQRFLIVVTSEEAASPITVILNWKAGTKK